MKYIGSGNVAFLAIFLIAAGMFSSGIMMNAEADSHTTGSPYLLRSPYIAANVNLGDPIDVCSGDYPQSTEAAVKLWNDSLSNYLDHDVFNWQKDESFCTGPFNSKDRIDYVIVRQVIPEKTPEDACDTTGAWGCLWDYDVNEERDTFIGRTIINIQYAGYTTDRDANKAFPACERHSA